MPNVDKYLIIPIKYLNRDDINLLICIIYKRVYESIPMMFVKHVSSTEIGQSCMHRQVFSN